MSRAEIILTVCNTASDRDIHSKMAELNHQYKIRKYEQYSKLSRDIVSRKYIKYTCGTCEARFIGHYFIKSEILKSLMRDEVSHAL